MAITTTLTGTDKVVRALAAIHRAVADMTPALQVVGASVKSNIQLGFRSGTSPEGQQWRHLRHRSGRPLSDTGRLARSFVVRPVGKTEVEVGTNVCYGIVHQYGATIEAGKPPHKTLCGMMTKGSPFLRWKDEDGNSHFAKKVHVPARPFMPAPEGLPEAWASDAIGRLAKAIEGKL